MRHDTRLAVKLYGHPSTPLLIGHIVNIGDTMGAARGSLATDPTPELCDQLVAGFKGGEHVLRLFRRALMKDGELRGDPD